MIGSLKNVCPGGERKKALRYTIGICCAKKKANVLATGSGNNGIGSTTIPKTNTNDPDRNWKSSDSVLSRKALSVII